MTEQQNTTKTIKRGPPNHIDLAVGDAMKEALLREATERTISSGKRVSQVEIIRAALAKELGLADPNA